jgi:hypothetical protein
MDAGTQKPRPMSSPEPVAEIEVELSSELGDRSRLRLPAVALLVVVKAVSEGLDGAAVGGKVALDPFFDRTQHGRSHQPACDPRWFETTVST